MVRDVRLEDEPGIPPLYLSFQGDKDDYDRKHFLGGVSLNLKTADVDICCDRHKQAGILFIEDITDHEWGDRAFSVEAPIGNLFYIYSEREIAGMYKDAIKE